MINLTLVLSSRNTYWSETDCSPTTYLMVTLLGFFFLTSTILILFSYKALLFTQSVACHTFRASKFLLQAELPMHLSRRCTVDRSILQLFQVHWQIELTSFILVIFVKVLLSLGGSMFFHCQYIYPMLSTHIIVTQYVSRSWRSELHHPTNQWVMFMSINSGYTHRDNLADNTVCLCWRTQNNTGIFLDPDYS